MFTIFFFFFSSLPNGNTKVFDIPVSGMIQMARGIIKLHEIYLDFLNEERKKNHAETLELRQKVADKTKNDENEFLHRRKTDQALKLIK